MSKAKSKHVGATIRQLREQLPEPLSQAELARRAQLTPAALSLIESGRSDPAWSSCCRLADALGVSVERLRS